MDKNIKNFIILTIVLLNALSFSSYAHAGFYDRLVSNELDNSTLVQPMSLTALGSFEKLFWNSQKPGDTSLTFEEPKASYEVVSKSIRQITAYNVGDIYQNDSTPCTGAYSKVNLCEEVAKGTRVCAANFVRLGTMLRIGEGDESFECIVWDRMNSRYPNRVDIAMNYTEKTQARQFGLQKMPVEILKELAN